MTETERRPSAPREGRRLALLLEYEGTRYAGSQFQPNAPTIQGELEAAVKKTTGEDVRAAFAGRTDAGVHATGQVAAFSTASTLDAVTVRNALNAWLPRDIAVRAVADVAADFDPRRNARRRSYRYTVHNAAVRPALERTVVWHVPTELDAGAMAEAAAALLGLRDFRAFAGILEQPEASTVRDLQRFDVVRDGCRISFDLTANAFLPHMVRRLVGALVQVGAGKLSAAEYAALLEGPPSSAGPAAPAQGLCLLSVEYPTALF